MTRKDWVLLALAAADGQQLSPAQLQKSLFILSRAMPEADRVQFYRFVPYHYGPFNSDIYADAELMQRSGLVSIGRRQGRRWAEYEATSAGLDRAKVLEGNAPSQLLEYLRRVVKWARSVTFQQLIRAIYAKYPEYRSNSVFQG